MPNTPLYLWIMAPSGSGKTTAVTNCVADAAHALRERLGIAGRRVRLCTESLDGAKHEELLSCLTKTYPPEATDVLLIDGQWPDVQEKTDTIRKWRDANPEATHRIIWLNVAPEEAARRIREHRGTRPNARDWEPGYTTKQATGHHRNMVACAERLMRLGIEVLVFDASTYDYSPSSWDAVREHCTPKTP